MLNYFKLILILLVFIAPILKAEFQQCEYDPTFTIKNQINSKWTRDSSKYVSPFSLYKNLVKNSDYLLADLRSSNDFNNYHIESSINFPHTSLQTKSIFRNNDIVLIGNGRDYKRLEQTYENLKSLGFNSIKILDGGIYFWRSVIDHRSLLDKEILDLNHILNEDRSNWVIFDSLANSKVQDLFPNVIAVTQSFSELNADSYKAITKQSNQLIKNILLVSSEENINLTINEWQLKLNANVFSINKKLMRLAVNDYYSQQKIQSYKKRTDGAKFSCL
jgi:rhodanese-related sulfurtransferase